MLSPNLCLIWKESRVVMFFKPSEPIGASLHVNGFMVSCCRGPAGPDIPQLLILAARCDRQEAITSFVASPHVDPAACYSGRNLLWRWRFSSSSSGKSSGCLSGFGLSEIDSQTRCTKEVFRLGRIQRVKIRNVTRGSDCPLTPWPLTSGVFPGARGRRQPRAGGGRRVRRGHRGGRGRRGRWEWVDLLSSLITWTRHYI